MSQIHLFKQAATKGLLRSLMLTVFMLVAFAVNANAQSYTGIVTDKSGSPIIGANVMVDGTTTGITTGLDGEFTLPVKDGDKLIVSYLGYTPREAIYNGKQLDIELLEDNMSLDEVIVVGYGTQKKANLTGAVAAVNSEQLDGVPASNVTSMLQGRMAGVTITQTSGQPGYESTSINIRGVGTMNDSSPMVLIDGLEGDMNSVNPSDIESVSVLKDAAASAIYGTRAANGVILITTKRGSSGEAQVSYNGYVGKTSVINRAGRVDSWDYAEMVNEAYYNTGYGDNFYYSESDIAKFKDGSSPYTHPNTDWDELVFQGSGLIQSHNLSVTGGTDKSSYYVSLGYYDQEGNVKKTNYTRYNVRANVDTDIKKNLKFGVNTALSYEQNSMPQGQSGSSPDTEDDDMAQLFAALNRWSSAQLAVAEDGTWGVYSDVANMYAAVEDPDGGTVTNETARVNTSSYLQYQIMEGLSIKGVAGVEYSDLMFTDDYNATDNFYNGTYFGPSTLMKRNTTYMQTTLQAYLNFDRTFGGHGVKALAGISQEANTTEILYAYRYEFSSSDLSDLDAGGTSGMTNEGNTYKNRIGSYFARVNYDYLDKYLIEANVRIDGSSKFAEGYRWGTFPSFSAGWRVTQEEFMSSTQNWLDELKLRASWGQLGNHNIGNYKYAQLISLGDTVYPFTDGVVTGAEQTSANTPDISWETTTETNFGIDMMMFNNKLSFSIDYYNRYTDDILTTVPVSNIYGLSAPTTNSGAMSNKGFEIVLGYRNHIGELNYDVTGTFNKNKNVVEEYANPSIGTNFIKQEGIAWNSYYGYECIGVFMDEEDLASSAKHHTSCDVGDLKMKDQNNDGVIDGDDRVVLGNPNPNITYGLNINLSYKGFDLGVFFQGAAQVQRTYSDTMMFPLSKMDNVYDMHMDRTIVDKATNTVTSVGAWPRTLIDGEQNSETLSSFKVYDASYLRLKNLQLGYNIPSSVTSKLRLNRARVYVSGSNLLTFSSLPDGLEPEAPDGDSWGDGLSYPQVATYVLGLDINF